MGQKRLELFIDQRISGAAELKKLAEEAERVIAAAKAHTAEATNTNRAMREQGDSAAKAALQFGALAAAAAGAGATIKALTVDSALYAARTQTLAVVTDQLARVNHLNRDAVRAEAEAVRRQGITRQESLQTINKMIFAQLDVAKATNVARLAQDAAVIAGINSSEALNGIIHGIVTRQPEVLRTYGLIVNFEQDFAKAARELGRELTAGEKTQISMNAVLREGTKITGTYEASMTTAGKQVTSLKRHFDETKDALGQGLIPALGRTVSLMEQMAKFAQENAEQFTKMATGVTAAGVAYGAFRLTPGPLPLKLAAAAVAGGATYLYGNQDPVEYYTDAGRKAVGTLSDRQRKLTLDLENRKITPEEYKTQYGVIDEQIEQIRKNIAEEIGRVVWARERERLANPTNWKFQNKPSEIPTQPIDLGNGRKIMPGELAGNSLSQGGALFNQEAFDRAQNEALKEQYAGRVKAAQKKIDDLVRQMLEAGLSPLEALEIERGRRLQELGLTSDQKRQINEAFDRRSSEIFAKWFNDETQKLNKAAEDAAKTASAVKSNRREELDKAIQDSFKKLDEVVIKPYLDAVKEISDIQFDAQRTGIARRSGGAVRLAQLQAGPGGESAAIRAGIEERIRLAHELLRIDQERANREQDTYKRAVLLARSKADFEREIDEAKIERELKYAELQQKNLREYMEGAGRIYDSLISRNASGIRDFFMGQVHVAGRRVFQNVAGLGYEAFKGLNLELPGQTQGGDPSKLTTLGRILQGTPLGVDPARALQVATSTNTQATAMNTLAMEKMNAMFLQMLPYSASAGGGGAMAGLSKAAAGDLSGIIGLFAGKSGLLPGITPDSRAAATMVDNMAREALGLPPIPGTTHRQAGSTILKGAAVAAGGFGVYSGVRQGGPQGYATAAASALGTAAALDPEPISRAVLTLAAAGAGIFGAALGNPKERKARSIDERIESAMYGEPASVSRNMDLWGSELDYDRSGQIRTYNVKIEVPVHIDAMDSQSIADRYEDIGAAVAVAVNKHHPVLTDLRGALLPE